LVSENENTDIRVAVISNDPFFLFATRGLLGRDRYTRIVSKATTLDEFDAALAVRAGHIDVVVCDLDSAAQGQTFFEKLHAFASSRPEVRILSLVAGNLADVAARAANIPLAALLAKADLGYCLHLAVRAVHQYEVVLVTERIKPLLEPGTYLYEHARALGPYRAHPDLSERKEEVAMLRVFVGLDNPDISDELSLSDNVVREYVSDIYTALGTKGELDVFEALSEWWWTTRFLQALV
jgi:DNA-binding NarL/FixJ family response regulator